GAAGAVASDLADGLLAPTGLTEKKASFDRRDLLRGVCEQLPAGTPVRLGALRALATRVLRDDRVVPLLGDAPVTARRYSTRELLTLETDALAGARRLAGTAAGDGTGDAAGSPAQPCATVPAEALEDVQQHAAAAGLSGEQQQMVQRLLTSGAGVEVVVGAAGSGKTAALAVAAAAWAKAGIPVQGTALAAIAARVLQDSAGIPSLSLQRLLNQTLPAPGGAVGKPNTVLPTGGVLVVDEAGMVGTRTLHCLLTLAEQTRTKLVLVGDPRQLPEIDAGGLFATLAARLPAVALTGNQRQQQPWEQRALRELRDGDVLRALLAYGKHGRLRITDTLQELTATLLEDYEQHLRSHRPDRVLVIASSRGDARRLNAHLRQRLLEHGHLGDQELRIPLADRASRGYRTGEQVLVTANDYPQGLLNGTRGTVTDLHPGEQALTVRLDDGRQLRLEADYLRSGRLAHGYALTAHKAQGVTVDVALLWGTSALSRETGYVAMSRGRQHNALYSTWDLLHRDAGLTDAADLDRPAVGRGPDLASRRTLARAGLAERLASSSAQRTAHSWWRRRTSGPSGAESVSAPRQATARHR
ncbi:MAG: conjugal transfer protein TraA, partial [Frankiales bacterium]|nr:conjugal transfer protein TraA [Frankiales bacterium]